MSENKKKVAKEILSGENNKGEKAVNQPTEKKKIAPITIALIITAAILACVIIAVAVVLITDYVKKDKGFDYMTSNLDKYLEFTEDYKNFSVNVDIAKPHDMDVDVAMLNLLAADKDKESVVKGKTEGVLGAGDVVTIWYRGYLIGEDGSEIVVANMSNFASANASTLELGSASFVSGFELGLVGINLADYAKFEKIKEGEVKESHVVYVTYTRVTSEGDNVKKNTESSLRIDLSEDVDKVYGEGFKQNVIGTAIGGETKKNFSTKIDGQVYNYNDFKVDFVTECEANPIVVDVYFPYDYSQTTLRNESAKFEVYVDSFDDYTCEYEEICDEYLQKKFDKNELSITLDELNKYEGETLTEKYYAFAEEAIWNLYEQEYKVLLEEAIWAHYQEIVTIKKYPVSKVEKIYDDYVADVFDQFLADEGKIYNSYTGSYSTYETLDTYAPVYLGISTTEQTWREYLYSNAEALIKERLIMFYLMRNEGFAPSEEDFEKLLSATREEYISEYVNQYLSYQGKTKDDYTEDEYAKFVAEREKEIFDYYSDDYFEEVTYYNIVVKNIVDWPTIKVSTLDERRAYPVNQ